MKVTLHPGAEKDIEQAAAFYEREGSSVLAARFVAEFKRLAGLVSNSPESDHRAQKAGVASQWACFHRR